MQVNGAFHSIEKSCVIKYNIWTWQLCVFTSCQANLNIVQSLKTGVFLSAEGVPAPKTITMGYQGFLYIFYDNQ